MINRAGAKLGRRDNVITGKASPNERPEPPLHCFLSIIYWVILCIMIFHYSGKFEGYQNGMHYRKLYSFVKKIWNDSFRANSYFPCLFVSYCIFRNIINLTAVLDLFTCKKYEWHGSVSSFESMGLSCS